MGLTGADGQRAGSSAGRYPGPSGSGGPAQFDVAGAGTGPATAGTGWSVSRQDRGTGGPGHEDRGPGGSHRGPAVRTGTGTQTGTAVLNRPSTARRPVPVQDRSGPVQDRSERSPRPVRTARYRTSGPGGPQVRTRCPDTRTANVPPLRSHPAGYGALLPRRSGTHQLSVPAPFVQDQSAPGPPFPPRYDRHPRCAFTCAVGLPPLAANQVPRSTAGPSRRLRDPRSSRGDPRARAARGTPSVTTRTV